MACEQKNKNRTKSKKPMKKILLFIIILAFIFTTCGKKDEGKQEEKKDVVKKEEVKDDILKDLLYQQDLSVQYGDNMAEGRLTTKEEKNNVAYILHIYYKGDWKGYKQEEFKSATEKIRKYPAIIEKSGTSILVYVQVIPNVLVFEEWRNDFLKGFDNLDAMKKIALMYDLEGLEKLTVDKISGTELAKYFPKFEKK